MRATHSAILGCIFRLLGMVHRSRQEIEHVQYCKVQLTEVYAIRITSRASSIFFLNFFEVFLLLLKLKVTLVAGIVFLFSVLYAL